MITVTYDTITNDIVVTNLFHLDAGMSYMLMVIAIALMSWRAMKWL
jgi:hypothetical protein